MVKQLPNLYLPAIFGDMSRLTTTADILGTSVSLCVHQMSLLMLLLSPVNLNITIPLIPNPINSNHTHNIASSLMNQPLI